MRVQATTDVRLREQWHDRGTMFSVSEEIGDLLVDATTAGQWVRLGWAEEVGEEGPLTPRASPVALSPLGRGEEGTIGGPSAGADAPPSPQSGEGKKTS